MSEKPPCGDRKPHPPHEWTLYSPHGNEHTRCAGVPLIFNTTVTVVANLEAPDARAAVTMLATALKGHGFDVITDHGQPPSYADAFEAEAGTARTYVKAGCNYQGNPYAD